MKIAIGTTNRAKVAAVTTAATMYIKEELIVEPIGVASGVSDQPMSDEETKKGAVNRAKAALVATNADIAFGLEGGVKRVEDTMYLCNWAAIVSKEGRIYTAAGAQIPLPEEIANELENGRELGPVMDVYAKQQNTREHSGAIGVFTNGLVDRQQMFEHILTLLIGQYTYWKNR
ncbi:DUF84 family protein [Kurthia senegalensis]|uniref:DUF84 family protein n=1 Tax=Kurthia senegalensis TaxID=1033740 RepID=UPI000287DA03|nr:DUF84 family protein [Kurthia senegalensis]